jgi:AcrR family transcriptional regulator
MASSRREKTRQKLIRAAFEVVAKEGFEAASVDAIARRAGYSIGALYSNFGGKDELFFAVFDEHVSWFEEQLEAAAESDDRVGLVGDWMDQTARHPEQFLIFVEFWAYAVRKPKTRRQLAQRLEQMRARLTELLGDERLALLSLATARGLALEKLADADAVPDQVVTDLAAATLGQVSAK